MLKVRDFFAYPMAYTPQQQVKASNRMSQSQIVGSYLTFGTLTVITLGVYYVGNWIAREIVKIVEKSDETKKIEKLSAKVLSPAVEKTAKEAEPLREPVKEPAEPQISKEITESKKESIEPKTKESIEPKTDSKTTELIKSVELKLEETQVKGLTNEPVYTDLAKYLELLGGELKIYSNLLNELDALRAIYNNEQTPEAKKGIAFDNLEIDVQKLLVSEEEKTDYAWISTFMKHSMQSKNWGEFENNFKKVEQIVFTKLLDKLNSMNQPPA